MRSVRGSAKGWSRLRSKKAPKPQTLNSKVPKCYGIHRKESLEFLGYKSYYLYLKSKEWSDIRSRMLSHFPLCLLCGKTACQVHHISYDVVTLAGGNLARLVSLCRRCHEGIEFDKKGDKATLFTANLQLFKKALKGNEVSREWARNNLTDRCFKQVRRRLIRDGIMSNKESPKIR